MRGTRTLPVWSKRKVRRGAGFPALVGAVLGVFPGSVLLFAAINAANDSDDTASPPPPGQLAAVVLLTVLVVALLTAVPARLGARRPTATTLRAEHP